MTLPPSAELTPNNVNRCLAVNYLDRFLQSQPLASECLQLTGITALWVAAKQVLYLDPCGWVDFCIEVTKLVFSTYMH